MNTRLHRAVPSGMIGSVCALVVCLAWALTMSPGAAALQAEIVDARFDSAPHRLVQDTSEQLLQLIGESRAYADADPDRFFAAVDALLTPVLDFNGFARGVMSVHYRKATADQRKRFAENFKTSLLRTYAVSLTKFEDGEVAVLPPDGPPRRPNRRNVKMEIRAGASVYPVVYTMNLGKDGAWRIGNIVIAGVNMGLTFRSQFRSAVSDIKYGGDLDRVIDAWAGVVTEDSPGDANESAGA